MQSSTSASSTFHAFQTDSSGLTDPTVHPTAAHGTAVSALLTAASTGDLTEIRRLKAEGLPLTVGDYDARTALHLAAAAAAFFLAVMFMLLTFSCLGSRRSAPSSEALATEEEPEKKTAEGAADGDQASTSASEAGNDGSPPCTTWRAPPSEEQ